MFPFDCRFWVLDTLWFCFISVGQVSNCTIWVISWFGCLGGFNVCGNSCFECLHCWIWYTWNFAEFGFGVVCLTVVFWNFVILVFDFVFCLFRFEIGDFCLFLGC